MKVLRNYLSPLKSVGAIEEMTDYRGRKGKVSREPATSLGLGICHEDTEVS